MRPLARITVLAAVASAVVGALALKRATRVAEADLMPVSVLSEEIPEDPVPPTYETTGPGLPRLVALGAGKCIPCRAMAPIRAELRREYAGALVVDFYDVWKNPDAGRHFGIRAIPTLIFYDAAGAELARREGYLAKAEILATMERLGMHVEPTSGATAQGEGA
jgi:thioredoxin 1